MLGPSRSPTTAVVRVAGIASQISASRFHAAFGQSSAIRHAVQTHTRAVLMQFQHVAACNALHPVEARMARWLLHTHDRIDGSAIPLTQEALSQLLGVRRTTVTLVMQKLRASDVIGAAWSRSTKRGSKQRHASATRSCAATLIGLFRGYSDAMHSRCAGTLHSGRS